MTTDADTAETALVPLRPAPLTAGELRKKLLGVPEALPAADGPGGGSEP